MRQCSFPQLHRLQTLKLIHGAFNKQSKQSYKFVKIMRDIYFENKPVSFRHVDASFDRTFCRSFSTCFLLGIIKPRFYNITKKLKIMIRKSCHKSVCTQH